LDAVMKVIAAVVLDLRAYQKHEHTARIALCGEIFSVHSRTDGSLINPDGSECNYAECTR
jgi:hypothetical protein